MMRGSRTRRWRQCYHGGAGRANRAGGDQNGHEPWFDLLYSGGSHDKALFNIPEMHASFTYSPGTLVAICGKIFRHEVMKWSGKDRLCLAHYFRLPVVTRLNPEDIDPGFVSCDEYLPYCSERYKEIFTCLYKVGGTK